MKRRDLLKLAALALLCAFGLSPLRITTNVSAQQRNDDADVDARIVREENANSQIMRTLHFFTDVYGPRLTGSPSLKAAGEWAVNQMRSWGFENAH